MSIRPNKATVFNALAEDIDFAVYPKKLNSPCDGNSYNPALYALNSDGLPIGLIPAIKVNAYTENSVSGSLESGIVFSGYIDHESVIPSGYHRDDTGKVCVNTNTPFTITTIPNGSGSLALYADLTINQNLYTKGLIVDTIKINPTPSLNATGRYVINAPLTINASGQIVSQSPDTLPTVPGSPVQVTGVVGNGSVNLSWVAPAKNGGKPVINYNIEYSTDLSSWTPYTRSASVDTFVLVTGLNNSTAYSFRVSAINSVGTGNPSQIYGPVSPLSTIPGPVTNFVVSRGPKNATLHWTDPVGTIIGYEMGYSSDNGATWTSVSPSVSGQTAVVNAIEDEPYYLFRVRAQNSGGFGPFVIKGSIGTDPPPPVVDPSPTSIWDFGIVSFTGVCS